jgi:hypothetical protein
MRARQRPAIRRLGSLAEVAGLKRHGRGHTSQLADRTGPAPLPPGEAGPVHALRCRCVGVSGHRRRRSYDRDDDIDELHDAVRALAQNINKMSETKKT